MAESNVRDKEIKV